MVDLVRVAMASGVARFADPARAGQVDPHASIDDAFGDWPARFVRLRADLVEALTSRGEVPSP